LKKDNKELAKKIKSLADEAYEFGSPWSEALWLESLEDKFTHCLVSEKNEEVVAFLLYHQLFENVEVLNVAVSPYHQGRGLAQELFAQLFEQVSEITNLHVILEVRKANLPAIGLYEKVGFAKIAERKNYYHHPTDDALIMEWKNDE
jgi:ribosomal-protein-alanine N-acetyltransferase